MRGPKPVLAGVVGRRAEGGKEIQLGVVSKINTPNILHQHSPLPGQRPGVMRGATADLVRGDLGYTKGAIPKVRGKIPVLADTVETTTGEGRVGLLSVCSLTTTLAQCPGVMKSDATDTVRGDTEHAVGAIPKVGGTDLILAGIACTTVGEDNDALLCARAQTNTPGHHPGMVRDFTDNVVVGDQPVCVYTAGVWQRSCSDHPESGPRRRIVYSDGSTPTSHVGR